MTKKTETVEEFLARGGKITVCPPQASPEPQPSWDDTKVKPEWAMDDEEVPSTIVKVRDYSWLVRLGDVEA